MATADGTSSQRQANRELEVDKLLPRLVKLEGSDLHLKVGKPPYVRVKGALRPLNRRPIDDDEMERLLMPMLNERNRKIFDETGGADFAYLIDVDGVNWRFRVNMLQQLGHVGLVARRVNNLIPDFEGLYLPPVIESLCKFDQGMVLLAGVTGSGKSTTIASMLNWINQHYRKHILTLEDPIEFVFTEDKCLINQREIGMDVNDFDDRHEARRPRRPRRDAGGRNARPRDVHDGHPRRRDGPPGVRHDSRLQRRQHDRPHSRPVPAGHAPGPAQRHRLQHEGRSSPRSCCRRSSRACAACRPSRS